MENNNPDLKEMFNKGTEAPQPLSEAELAMRKVIEQSAQKQNEAVAAIVTENKEEVVIPPTGGGIVIETPKQEAKEDGIKVGTVPAHIMEGVENLMGELDESIEIAKQIAEEKAAEEEAKKAEQEAAEEDEDEFDEDKYNKAIVIIDKLGMGTVNFTDEERAKMEKVKKIEVQEVEVLSLETLKVKRNKNQSIDKVLQAKKNVGGTSNIVLVGSGYTAVMGKCSLFELSNLFLDKENLVETQLSKWGFIYSKLISSSVKFKSFDDFIKSTAVSDYSTFIFGILCASYPDVDEIGLKCTDTNCIGKLTRDGKETKTKDYEFKYDIRSIIRAERMSEGLLEKVQTVIDNSYVEATAIETHKNAPVSIVKRYKLPESGYIIDAGVESVHDFIYNAARVSDSLEDEKYRQTLTTSTMIRKLYIPDDEDGYYEFEDKLDIAKALYELYGESDIKALIKQNAELSKDLTIEYGFANVTCPYCKNVTPFVPVDPDDILFHKYRQATMTE